ncbi:cation diffusion facilitator family transporter [Luteolibacter sp. AS25]|uniref:cation diffusion facilitator family transporter n=1 Tax=Luteolibacter sp. AS25 TaxID=3135776 RepID=UPI00398B8FD4
MSAGHNHDHQHGSSGNLKLAFFLNLSFTIIEIFGGFWTNSIAILTDSVHDLGDSISLGLAWYFENLSKKGRTPLHTYGYRRFRLMGGLITGFMLLIGLSFVLYHAVLRLNHPQEVNAQGMIWLAVLGVAFNGIAVLRMKHGTSLTEKLVSWHLIEDALGWIAVLLGAGIMMIWDVPFIDPLLSICISLFVLWNVIRNLKKVFSVILQTVPEDFDITEFERKVTEVSEISSIHHVHCWSIDGESHVLSAHLVVNHGVENYAEIKAKVRDFLDEHHFEHVTLEIVKEGESCRIAP